MPHQCTNCGHTFPDGSKEMLSGCPDCGGNKFQFKPNGVADDESADADGAADAADANADATAEPAGDSGVSSAVGKAAASVRDFVSSDEDEAPRRQSGVTFDDGPDAEDTESAATDTGTTERDVGGADTPGSDGDAAEAAETVEPAEADREDTAQASARTDMVESGDLPRPEEREDAGDTPDMSELRDQLEDTDQPDEEPATHEPGEERPDMDDLREELNDQFESIRIVAPGQYELNLMELYDRDEYIIALQENGRYVIEVPDTWDAPE